MDPSPASQQIEMAVQCQRCARWFMWRYGKAITRAALWHRPLYCPACRKLVSQHRIAV